MPFNNSFAPGAEELRLRHQPDLDHRPRAKQVDFSTPYYTTPQAVVVGKGSQYARATTFAELSDARFGVQRGTTSLDAVNDVISPNQRPRVYNDSNDAVRALKSGQVDAIVVDLPTAFILTATRDQGRHDRGPVPGPRRRGLGRGPGQGLRADPVRGRGDRPGARLG